jgi:hypothetical protein
MEELGGGEKTKTPRRAPGLATRDYQPHYLLENPLHGLNPPSKAALFEFPFSSRLYFTRLANISEF